MKPWECDSALHQGLLGSSPEYQHLYGHSATFHAQIDLLVQMLPFWVDGLAAQAEEIDCEQKARYEQIMHALL